jgi:hypothetical protein
MHSAFAALIGLAVSHLCRRQAIHAIMQAYHETCTNGEVNEKQYGCKDLFHLLRKDSLQVESLAA